MPLSACAGRLVAPAFVEGAAVDIHLHDPGPLGAFELRDIAARTAALGLQGRVAVSHADTLGTVDDAQLGRTAEALAQAGVALMTNGPGAGPTPPLLRLAADGVTVFAGSDNGCGACSRAWGLWVQPRQRRQYRGGRRSMDG